MRKLQSILPFATVLISAYILQGCSTPEEKRLFDQGWRQAEVVNPDVGSSSIRGMTRDCRRGNYGATSGNRFALVTYGLNSNPKMNEKQIALAGGDVAVKVGDKVLVNVENCDAPLMKP